MSIPLVATPPLRPDYEDLINGNDRLFTSTVGSWTNSGGTLSRQTTGGWMNNAPRLQLVTTATGQYARLPLSGSFKAGERYDFIIVVKLAESPASVSWRVRFGLDGTDHVNTESTHAGTIAPGGNTYRIIGGSWIPTADRTGVTLTFYRVGVETGTQTWSIAYARAARVANGGLGLRAMRYEHDSSAGVFRGHPAVYSAGGAGWEIGHDYIQMRGATAGTAAVNVDPDVTVWAEHTAALRPQRGVNIAAGTDYIGVWISERAVDELQVHPDFSDHYVTLLDGHQAGATKGWRAMDEAGNPTGLLSKSPFRKFASAPGSPAEGDCYYDTTTHKLRVFDGTIWQDAW